MTVRDMAATRGRTRSRHSGDPSALSVTEVLHRAQGVLEASASEIVVCGELAEWKVYPSGHCYGAVRDSRSQLSIVMYRREAMQLAEHPSVGSELLLFGSLAVYAGHGKLQCVVRDMRLRDGRGLEALARDRLVESLREEGHLDPRSKRPVPDMPRAVGLVTSLGSAALGDITAGLSVRAPWVRLVVAHANLADANSIAGAVLQLAHSDLVSVLILARGGGSAVDLSPFDSAPVAHAIVQCPVPVVSAVGHDLHVTVADLVADRRAATPSAACEIVVPDASALRGTLRSLRDAAGSALSRQLIAQRTRVDSTSRALRFALQAHLSVAGERARRMDQRRASSAVFALFRNASAKLHHLAPAAVQRDLLRVVHRCTHSLRGVSQQSASLSALTSSASRLNALKARLDACAPTRLMERGSALIETAEGRWVRSVDDVSTNGELRILMRGGTLLVRVTSILPEVRDDR